MSNEVVKLRQEILDLYDAYKRSIDESTRLIKKLDETRKALRAIDKSCPPFTGNRI